MARISSLIFDLQTDILEGTLSFQNIAAKHNVPVSWVDEANEDLNAEDAYYDYDRADDASALASAGFGTDEDYGCYTSDDEF